MADFPELRPERIIPAYAGSTSKSSPRTLPVKDHPRIRGEHRALNPGGVFSAGSSPHTRGAPSAEIPPIASSRDHPRIRGEHLRGDRTPRPGRGSSPHTRGAPTCRPPGTTRPRIIPAYAGSTASPPSTGVALKDHPRIRGEHQILAVPGGALEGSSPHTRGALSAGCRSALPAQDHPRIRGEHGVLPVHVDRVGGSSPHTRGALRKTTTSASTTRIIPAYAGSTPSATASVRARKDHPRIRGEHGPAGGQAARWSGSSPHTRGALQKLSRLRKQGGIIPAYAGSTSPSAAW